MQRHLRVCILQHKDQSCRLTAVDVGIAILVDVMRHGALNVRKARRLDCQNLGRAGLT